MAQYLQENQNEIDQEKNEIRAKSIIRKLRRLKKFKKRKHRASVFKPALDKRSSVASSDVKSISHLTKDQQYKIISKINNSLSHDKQMFDLFSKNFKINQEYIEEEEDESSVSIPDESVNSNNTVPYVRGDKIDESFITAKRFR